jgi:hypothetical protein
MLLDGVKGRERVQDKHQRTLVNLQVIGHHLTLPTKNQTFDAYLMDDLRFLPIEYLLREITSLISL